MRSMLRKMTAEEDYGWGDLDDDEDEEDLEEDEEKCTCKGDHECEGHRV